MTQFQRENAPQKTKHPTCSTFLRSSCRNFATLHQVGLGVLDVPPKCQIEAPSDWSLLGTLPQSSKVLSFQQVRWPGVWLGKSKPFGGSKKNTWKLKMTHGITLNMEANDSCDMNRNLGKSRGQASQTFYARSDQNRWFKHIVSSFFVPNSLHHPQPHPKCVTPRKKATQIAFYKLQQQNKTN